ncbi:hypothetical protein EPUL_006677, partial [Erysiphe pulchra]
MLYIQILTLLACAQVAISNPVSVQSKPKGPVVKPHSNPRSYFKAVQLNDSPGKLNATNPTQDSVKRAASNFAQDVGIVSNAINEMANMTDQDAIKATALRALKAEVDEDDQRAVLATAAGQAGAIPNSIIQQYTPTVFDGLDAISTDASPDSVAKNIKKIEDV